MEVDRRHVRSTNVLEAVNLQSQAVIDRGHSLIIYPEGTRSRDGELQPFKKGAFTMAIQAGMPVLPVTIHGTRRIWEPMTPWIRSGTVRVVIDRPIPTNGMGRSDAEALRDEVQRQSLARLHELRSFEAQR